jgi:hypothetical protein
MSDLSVALANLIQAVPAKDRRSVALALCLRALKVHARNGMLPSAARQAQAHIDVFSDLVPDRIRQMLGESDV